MNSIAKEYDCSIKYNKNNQTIHFYGNKSYQRHIIEKSLSFFPKIEKYLLDTDQDTLFQEQINPMELYEKRDLIFKIEDLLAQSEYLSIELIAELKISRNQLISDLEGSFLIPKSFFVEKDSCAFWLEDEESIDE